MGNISSLNNLLKILTSSKQYINISIVCYTYKHLELFFYLTQPIKIEYKYKFSTHQHFLINMTKPIDIPIF